jgi:hypothetical protein
MGDCELCATEGGSCGASAAEFSSLDSWLASHDYRTLHFACNLTKINEFNFNSFMTFTIIKLVIIYFATKYDIVPINTVAVGVKVDVQSGYTAANEQTNPQQRARHCSVPREGRKLQSKLSKNLNWTLGLSHYDQTARHRTTEHDRLPPSIKSQAS